MCCPETDPWAGGAQVAQGYIQKLVAAFNFGWKMSDTRGGSLPGRALRRAVARRQASLVIERRIR